MGLMMALVAVAAIMLTSTRAEALHLKSPLLTQVTDRPSQTLGGAHFTMVSNVMVFHSDADLLGNGNTVPQIFVFDTAKRILKHQRAFYQLTFGDQGSFYPSGSPRASTFAYHSAGDPLGNGSTGRQVFTARQVHFKHPEKIKLVQLTKGLGESYNAQLNFSGRYIVFTSTGDLNSQGLWPVSISIAPSRGKLRNSRCGSYPCTFGGENPGLELVTPVTATDPAVSRAATRSPSSRRRRRAKQLLQWREADLPQELQGQHHPATHFRRRRQHEPVFAGRLFIFFDRLPTWL
jgi:hypothetical protein